MTLRCIVRARSIAWVDPPCLYFFMMLIQETLPAAEHIRVSLTMVVASPSLSRCCGCNRLVAWSPTLMNSVLLGQGVIGTRTPTRRKLQLPAPSFC